MQPEIALLLNQKQEKQEKQEKRFIILYQLVTYITLRQICSKGEETSDFDLICDGHW